MAKQSSHGGTGGAAEGEGGGAGGKKPGGGEDEETRLNRVLRARELKNAPKLAKQIKEVATEVATAVATATVRKALAAAGIGEVGRDGGDGGAGDAQVAILLPASLAERLDRHAERLSKEHLGREFSRVDAVQALLDEAEAGDERRSGKG